MAITPFAKRLRLARKARNLSVKSVAERLGIHESAVRHHENGARVPPVHLLWQYVKLYRISADWIYSGIGKGPDDPDDLRADALQEFDQIEPADQAAALDVLRALAKKRSGPSQ